jgi:hypothetical protein
MKANAVFSCLVDEAPRVGKLFSGKTSGYDTDAVPPQWPTSTLRTKAMEPSMDDEQRETQSEVMAQGFLIEILLSHYLQGFPPQQRQHFANGLSELFLSAFAPVQLPDDQAELLADVRVRALNYVRKHLQTAVEIANATQNLYQTKNQVDPSPPPQTR